MSQLQEELPQWDLSDLYQGVDDPNIEKDLIWSLGQAKRFEELYKGKIAQEDLTGPFLQEALKEFESITEMITKIVAYAYLVFATDTEKQGPFLQKIQERETEIAKHLIWFDLEWRKTSKENADRILGEESLTRYRHYFSHELEYAPHSLSEPEEKILDEKANTGSRAFIRLFDEIINNIKFTFSRHGQKKKVLTEPEVLKYLYDADRENRKAAAKSLTKGLKENAHTLTFIFNVLAQDKKSSDRLRAYEHIMGARNLDNEVDQETVKSLMQAVENDYEIVHRYYRLKGAVHGYPLKDYDRYAPVPFQSEQAYIPYEEAQQIILGAFGAFSTKMADIAQMFFERNWIDAAPRAGKRGGAFSHSVVPSVHPYILTSYFGSSRDVMTLAHELGHGIHQYLSRDQGLFHAHTPLTTAETASVFGEMLVFDFLMKRIRDPRERFVLLMEKIAEILATVSRQIALTKFEEYMHTARRKEGELKTERINELWMEANRPMFGDSVMLTSDYAWWWMYIPHFIHSPFYCYAYSFGELLVLSLYHKYLTEGGSFISRYLALLSAGGSDSPDVLFHEHMKFNITDPDFWPQGMILLREMVGKAETLWTQIKNK